MPDGRPLVRRPVRHCVVVVPAFDEAATIGGTVRSVLDAAAVLPADVTTHVVVVANGCCDATAGLAREAGAHVLELSVPNVGAARAAGFAWALGRTPVDRTWIATTDADGLVPADWLLCHLEAARVADVFVGTIVLDADGTAQHPGWWARYLLGVAPGEGPATERDHRHVHGANLGVRADVYAAAGGFRALAAHEDLDLLERLTAAGAVLRRTTAAAVQTSARHASRVVAGVGPDLAESLTTTAAAGAHDSPSIGHVDVRRP